MTETIPNCLVINASNRLRLSKADRKTYDRIENDLGICHKGQVNVFYMVNKGCGVFRVVYTVRNKTSRYWKAFVYENDKGELVVDKYSIPEKVAIAVTAQVLELTDLYRVYKDKDNDL